MPMKDRDPKAVTMIETLFPEAGSKGMEFLEALDPSYRNWWGWNADVEPVRATASDSPEPRTENPEARNSARCATLGAMVLRTPGSLLLACSIAACSTRPPNTVRAVVQMEIGGQAREVDMEVHPVPVDPVSIPARNADLEEGEIVLGVVQDGVPMAYPIRFLALSEVLNDRVGEVSLAPTW